MKSKIIILLSLLTLVACTQHNSLTYDGLNGNVKSVELSTYLADMPGEYITIDDIDYELHIYPRALIEYDKQGNRTHLSLYTGEGEWLSSIESEYMDNWIVKQEIVGADSVIESSYEFIVVNGKAVDYKNLDNNEESTKNVYEFDGLKMKKHTLYSNDTLVSTTTYKYNKLWLKEAVTVNADGKEIFSQNYEYTRQGQPLSCVVVDHGSEFYKFNYEYNSDGFPVKYVRLFNEVEDWNIYYTYEYKQVDEQGNWTERVICEDDKPLFIQKRVINYY